MRTMKGIHDKIAYARIIYLIILKFCSAAYHTMITTSMTGNGTRRVAEISHGSIPHQTEAELNKAFW